MREKNRQYWTDRAWTVPLLVASLAIVETLSLLAQEATVPEESSWSEVGAFLAENAKPEHAIRVAPQWAESLLRKELGEPMAQRLVRIHDVDRADSVWEVSIRGKQHGDLVDMEPVEAHLFGRITINRYQKNAQQIVYDFSSKLHNASVRREEGECKKTAKGWHCGKPWKTVRLRYVEVEFQPRWCVFAHPEKNKTLTIEFPDVPDGRSLVLYTGIGDVYARKNGEGPVKIGVFSGNQPLGEVTHDDEDGWKRTDLPFRGGDRSIRFEISAPVPRQRQFCFHAELRQ